MGSIVNLAFAAMRIPAVVVLVAAVATLAGF